MRTEIRPVHRPLAQAALLALVVAAAPIAAQDPLPAGDLLATEIQAFLDALPEDEISDDPIRVFDAGSHRVGIYGAFRPQENPGPVVVYDVEGSEIYYILQGSGTLVTGGRMASRRALRVGSDTYIGPATQGGVSREVGPGDIIVIPGRTPHWWTELHSDIRYLILRPDPEHRLPLR